MFLPQTHKPRTMAQVISALELDAAKTHHIVERERLYDLAHRLRVQKFRSVVARIKASV